MNLKSSGESLSEVHSSVEIPKNKGFWKKIFAFIGPAYLIGVGYMDPGNWATDIAGGSRFGYQLIWVLLMSNLMALLLQSLSARLGIVRGLDLAQASRNTYPPYINIPLYILAEIAIAACDLAEIIGMAIGLQLLFGLPLIWGIVITVFDTLLILLLMHKGIRLMETFILSLVFVIGISFLAEMFIVQPHLPEVISGLKPQWLDGEALYIAIGIIGATVMPHNLYLHSSLVQTRRIEKTTQGIKDALRYNFFDTTIALNLAFFVNAAILILAATAFHKNGFYQVAEIQDAHALLSNIFGSMAPALFAIALICAGQSSTITGTLAGQIVMEGYLNLRIRPWLRRLITRVIAITPALFTILYFGEESLGKLLVLSQVVLSLQLGFAVIPLIHFTSDREKMKEFVIRNYVKVLAWIAALVIVLLNVKLVIDNIVDWIRESGQNGVYIWLFVVPVALYVGWLLLYVTFLPMVRRNRDKYKVKVPHGSALQLDVLPGTPYRKIAIAIDFSANDTGTIQGALNQGGKEAEYLLIHIVETAGARYLGEQVLDHETRSDEENLSIYEAELHKLGYRVHTHIGYGDPAKSIASIVNTNEPDLLVMGAHGHKGLKDVIFGSTLDAVRHRVKVSVLVINPVK